MLLKVLVFYGIAVIGGAHAASGWFNFHAAPPILAGISPGISGGGGSGNSGGIEGGGKLSTGGGSAIGIGLGGTFTWPQGRIPFLDDPALMANPDQAVALNNARMDLQVRTCLRFIPRKTEEDYVYFTDLGLQIECWNMFEYTKGKVPVNVGPSCLEPMRRPYKPKRVFSDCDIEYVNHLYNCPRRRKTSPICPAGHIILGRPETTTTTSTTTTTTTTTSTSTTTTTTPTTTSTTTTTTTTTTEDPTDGNPEDLKPWDNLRPEVMLKNRTKPIVKADVKIKGVVRYQQTMRPTTALITTTTVPVITARYVGTCSTPCEYNGGLVRLYRSYNDKIGVSNHYYTTDRMEQHLMTREGYIIQHHQGYLGQIGQDPACTCLKPLYRLYSDFLKDHLLTSSDSEKETAERFLGYKFERVLGFCTKEPGCGAYLPLYRFYNAIAKDHLYTVDQQEMNYYKAHPEHAYSYEYIECYVWQHNISSKGCPAAMMDPEEEDSMRR